MEVTLRDLETFVRVAKRRSFTRAGEELHVAQSAVSRTVQGLEHKLRCPLLSRAGKNVVLTPEGEQLLAIAERLLQHYRDSLDDFQRFLAGETGQVVLAVLPSVAVTLLPRALSSFLAGRSGAYVEIRDETSHNVVRDTLSGRVDFGIMATDESMPGLDRHPLATDRFTALLPKKHPLSQRRSVTWADLAAYPFITLSNDTSVRLYIDRAFSEAGVTTRSMTECSSTATVGALVAAGLGVSALPTLTHTLVAVDGLVTRDLTDPPVARTISVISRSSQRLSPAAARLVEHLVAVSPAVMSELQERRGS